MLNLFKKNKIKIVITELGKAGDRGQIARTNFEKSNFTVLEFQNMFKYSQKATDDVILTVIEKCCKAQDENILPILKNNFGWLPPIAKGAVLEFLSFSTDNDYGIKATELLMEILSKDYKNLFMFPIGNIAESERKINIVFPNVLEFVDNEKIKGEIFILLLESIKNNNLETDKVLAYIPMLKNELNVAENRVILSVLIELSIYFPEIYEIARGYVNSEDRLVSAVALTVALVLNKEIPPHSLENALKSNATRYTIYNLFNNYGLMDYLHERYKTGFAFASALLSYTLSLSNELEKEPNKIEFVKEIIKDNETYYVMNVKTMENVIGAIVYGMDVLSDLPYKFAEIKTFDRPATTDDDIEDLL